MTFFQGTLNPEDGTSSLGIWKHVLEIHLIDQELKVSYAESQINAVSLKVGGKGVAQGMKNTVMIGNSPPSPA